MTDRSPKGRGGNGGFGGASSPAAAVVAWNGEGEKELNEAMGEMEEQAWSLATLLGLSKGGTHIPRPTHVVIANSPRPALHSSSLIWLRLCSRALLVVVTRAVLSVCVCV
jgi:hypothetical protein